VIAGLLLLVNRFVGLATALLAPIIVNILCFHIFMMPSGLLLAILMTVIWGFLVFQHRRCFAGLFVTRD
jgi:hypothetical protein